VSQTLLEIEQLRVQYDKLLAVDDVSFTLRGGDLLGMIGPNGAGKTTTLRAAAGLQVPTTGSVRVLGHDVLRHPTRVGGHLAFTPDTPQVYDSLTVEDFLRFVGRCYRLDAATVRERIDHWLDQLWLTE
jgi:ABC-2 type transport system ATP-binding protein